MQTFLTVHEATSNPVDILANHEINYFFPDPPGTPLISGLSSGELIETGSPRKLTCSTSPAGHPPAKLVWFVGDEMVDSQYAVEDDTASAQITFVPRLVPNIQAAKYIQRNTTSYTIPEVKHLELNQFSVI